MADPKTPNLLARLTRRLFGSEIERQVQLAVRAIDDVRDHIISGQRALDRDRFNADRDEVLRDALEAWRLNPLARRIVSLTTQYVVGTGLTIESKDTATNEFLQAWWTDRRNRMATRAVQWCDELTQAGNLIVLVSTDVAGMSYLRAIPAVHVQEILTSPNDIEHELTVIEKAQWAPTEGVAGGAPVAADARQWPVYDEATDQPNPDGSWPTVALHYAVNRPVGAVWGESDLAPLLRWLSRYAAWLEDRVRLNKFRQSFMYVVRGVFKSAAERLARQAELNANPPTPGSILVTDANTEAWGVLHPQLDSFEAGEDGLAVKKMLSAGSGTPLHFLAEPESATRTTAEAAGGPTFRHYEQRQVFFVWLMLDVARVVLNRRRQIQTTLPAEPPLTVTPADISPRDNSMLASATAQIATAFAELRNRQTIDDAELLRMVYKFAGEFVDVEAMLKRGQAAGAPVGVQSAAPESEPAAEAESPDDQEDA